MAAFLAQDKASWLADFARLRRTLTWGMAVIHRWLDCSNPGRVKASKKRFFFRRVLRGKF
jgi:hypothetical protein